MLKDLVQEDSGVRPNYPCKSIPAHLSLDSILESPGELLKNTDGDHHLLSLTMCQTLGYCVI